MQEEVLRRERTEKALLGAQHQLKLHASELEKHVADQNRRIGELGAFTSRTFVSYCA